MSPSDRDRTTPSGGQGRPSATRSPASVPNRLLGVRAYFGFQFCFSLLLWAPIFYEYQRRMGLSDAQIFGVQSIYYLAFCLCELPTGWLADKIGYLYCMRLGGVVLVVANLLPVFTPTYHGFLWHWLLIALSRSLISGAASAYLYEFLRMHGEPRGFKLAEGRSRALGLVGKVVGWAGIGYLMEWHITMPYWLTAVSALGSVWYAMRLPTIHVDTHAGRRRNTIQLGAVFGIVRATPTLLLVMLQGVAIFVLARICQVNLFQPILADKGFGLGACGVVMAVTTLFEALGNAYPDWVRRLWTDLNAVFALTVVMAVSTSAMAWCAAWGTVTWLSVFSLAVGLSYPIQRQLINDVIPEPRYRATLMSLESVIDRACCAAVAPALGGFVARGAVGTFLHLAAAASLLLVVVLTVAMGRVRVHLPPRLQDIPERG